MPVNKDDHKWLTAAVERLEIPLVAWKPYGAFIYPFLKILILKLADTSGSQYEELFKETIPFSAYILPYANRQRVITFFEKDARLLRMRARFPKQASALKKVDMEKLRRYYYVLYPILVLKRNLLVAAFEEEIANQEYDRIIETFPGWLLQRAGEPAPEQIFKAQEIWNRVARIILQSFKETGADMVTEKTGKKLLKDIEERLWSELGIE